jgi:hypothetical protein
VRDFTGDGANAIYNEDGVMIDGSIKASKSKHDQPKDQNFQWLMAGFLPLTNERARSLPSSTFSTTNTRQLQPSGFVPFSRLVGVVLSLVFIIH